MTGQNSERRQATVMFADISGFTEMSENIDPEDITNLMNECFTVIGDIIVKNGGHIDKFIGDCIMALFGVPKAVENAPVQALNSAIEIRNAVYQINSRRKLEPALDIHIGINSGEVIAGSVGSREKKEYTVMGDTVNVASRLEDVSQRGQILAGEDTFRNTKGVFQFKKLDPVFLKGKKDRIFLYELESKTTVHPREETVSAGILSADLTGRDKEMDQLFLQLYKLLNGEGSVICLTGEAGVGKTRLVREYTSRDEFSRITCLEG